MLRLSLLRHARRQLLRLHAAVKFWPEIDKQVLRQFADMVPREQSRNAVMALEVAANSRGRLTCECERIKGRFLTIWACRRKIHFSKSNQFSWQDTNGWKDLNSKFVLMVYRDYVLTGRKDHRFSALFLARGEGGDRLSCSNSIMAAGRPKAMAIPIKLTTSGLSVARAPIPAACGSQLCVPPEEMAQATRRFLPRSPRYRDMFTKAQGQLRRQALEWRIFPVRHAEANITTTFRPINSPANGMPT